MRIGRSVARVKVTVASVVATLGLTAMATTPATAAGCASAVPGDVNGDGYAEVAVGEPHNDGGRGSVHVFFGRPQGLVVNASGTARDDQYFTQATPGVPGTAAKNHEFGSSVALGDFNADGCADLAVGATREGSYRGTVTVLYGSPAGIRTAGAKRFTIAALFGAGASSVSQRFGDALAVGDLDHDGIDDLAAGATGTMVGGIRAGGVVVLYGDASGLARGSTPAELVTRDPADVPGTAESSDGFGKAIAIGDFDGDGAAELAIGSPGDAVGGSIQTLERGVGGFGPGQPEPISQDTAEVPGTGEDWDAFGWSLAAGDVDGDGRDDLAVGAPGKHCSECDESWGQGAVVLLRGSMSGLTGMGSQAWSQDSPGVAGTPELENAFGISLAMGPLDAGPTDDLAIGAPGDIVGKVRFAGSVTILLGGPDGLTTDGAGGTRFTQDVAGIAGTAEADDAFGSSVAAAFVQGGAQASLIIGAPDETVRGVRNVGQIHQLARNAGGPNPTGSRTFHLDTPGVKGKPGRGDRFGAALR